MTQAASNAALSEVAGPAEATEESLQSLKEFSRLLEESDRFARLIEKADKYSDMVPPYILQEVQAGYRKQKAMVDEKLEGRKESFRKAYEEQLSEKEVLESICQKLRDRLKELRFRRIVGEYEEDHIQGEIRDLKKQLSGSMERLDRLEEVLDQYVIIGFDGIPGTAAPKAKQVSPPVRYAFVQEEAEEAEEAPEPEPEDDTPLPMLEENAPDPVSWKEEEKGNENSYAADPAYVPSGLGTVKPASVSSSYPQGYLTILDGSRKGDRVPLIPADIMLGSSPNTDVMLTDQGISESHARVFFKDRKYFLENLDVLGRSYVNGIQSKVSELNHNDVIRLGNLNLRVDFTPIHG
jgi:hypothetical protein